MYINIYLYMHSSAEAAIAASAKLTKWYEGLGLRGWPRWGHISIYKYVHGHRFICVYVYTYTYIFFYLSIYICTYVYTCKCIHIHICIFMHIFKEMSGSGFVVDPGESICLPLYIYIWTYIYICICMYRYIYVCISINVSIYTCNHACIFICIHICTFAYIFIEMRGSDFLAESSNTLPLYTVRKGGAPFFSQKRRKSARARTRVLNAMVRHLYALCREAVCCCSDFFCWWQCIYV